MVDEYAVFRGRTWQEEARLLSICQQKVKMKASLFAVALLALVAFAAAEVRLPFSH